MNTAPKLYTPALPEAPVVTRYYRRAAGLSACVVGEGHTQVWAREVLPAAREGASPAESAAHARARINTGARLDTLAHRAQELFWMVTAEGAFQ